MLNVNNNQQLKPHNTTVDTNSLVSIQIINNSKPITELIPTEVVHSEMKQMIEDVIVETKMNENRYYSEEKSNSVVNKESVEIINIPVEKNVEQIMIVKDTENVVNQSKVHVSLKDVELSRPNSPLWTYTLPAPPVFADNNASLDNQQPTQLCMETNTFYNDFTSTVGVERLCSETTTVISDTTIQPIICERKKLDDSFITIVQENNKLLNDTESEKSAEVITSDIEDGYQGGKKSMVMVLENKFNFQKDKMAHELKADDFEDHPVVLRHQISRSDSFHAIGQQNFRTSALSFSPQKSELKSKSISYISLVQAQKNEALLSKSNSNNMLYSKRKSTSELSITDSPSLQSLEVMKSILNSSRKSSLQDAVIIEQSLPYKGISLEDKIVVQSVTTEIKVAEKYSPIEETIAEKYSPIVETIAEKFSPIVKTIVEKDKQPEHSNKWKYQGPPKINLSTWSERPKIEVSIKSDNDYKFGGSSTLPRVLKTTSNNNNTTAITINQTTDDTDATEIQKAVVVMSNDENTTDEVDNRLPKVLGFEYKKKNSFVQLRETAKMPDNSIDSKISIKPRPVSMDVTTKSWTASPASQIISFNRLSTSHNKFVPVVYGFKLNNISEVTVNTPEPLSPKEPKLLSVVVAVNRPVVENKIAVENKTVVEVMRNKVNEKEPAPVVPLKPTFLRSTSVDDMSKKFRFTTYENRNSLTTVEPNPFSQQTLRRTGLKQKILLQDTETESMFGRVIEVQPTTIKLSNAHQSERKVSVDVVKTSPNRQLSSPNPPPPPPMAPSFKTMKKPHVFEVDTRNQLLESIKRFNRDLLKRE